MIENQTKDYSDYIQFSSNICSILSLLCGFTFAALTILLAQLPNPSILVSQLTLFFLAILFYVFLTLISWMHLQTIRYCKNVPPTSRALNTFSLVTTLSYAGLEFTVVLMFLIWNLNYLALVTGIVWAILAFQNVIGTRQFTGYRKTIK